MFFNLNVIEYYSSTPIKGFDDCFSDFRGCEIFEVPVLRIFGSTSTGKKGCIHVHGVFPYFSVRWKDVFPDVEVADSRRYTQELAWEIDKALNVSARRGLSFRHHVFNIVHHKGLELYGYHKEKEDFIRIYFYKPHDVMRAAEIMTNGGIMNKFIQPYQAHIPYLSQFMIDYNIFRTLEISKFKLRASNNTSDGNNSTETVNPWDNAELVENKWIISTNNSSLESSIDVATYSGLELDCCKADILNPQQTSRFGSNPGLLCLWDEERMRRKAEDPEAEITQAISQGTRKVVTTEKESQYLKFIMLKIFKKPPAQMSNDQQNLSETSDDNIVLPDSGSLLSQSQPLSPSSSFTQMVILMEGMQASCEGDSILGLRNAELALSDDEDDDKITREMSQRFTDRIPEDFSDDDETPPVIERVDEIVQLDGVYDDEAYEKFGPVLSKEERQVFPVNQNELTNFHEEPPILEPEQPLTSQACNIEKFSLRPCFVKVEKHPLLKLFDPSKPIPLSMLDQMNCFPTSLVKFQRTLPPEPSLKKPKISRGRRFIASHSFKPRLKSKQSRSVSLEKKGIPVVVHESISDLISQVECAMALVKPPNSEHQSSDQAVPTNTITSSSIEENQSKASVNTNKSVANLEQAVTDIDFTSTHKSIKAEPPDSLIVSLKNLECPLLFPMITESSNSFPICNKPTHPKQSGKSTSSRRKSNCMPLKPVVKNSGIPSDQTNSRAGGILTANNITSSRASDKHKNSKAKFPMFGPKKGCDPAKKNFLRKGSKARANSRHQKLSSKDKSNDLLFEKSPISKLEVNDDNISTKKVKFKDKVKHNSNLQGLKVEKCKSMPQSISENCASNKKTKSDLKSNSKQPKAKKGKRRTGKHTDSVSDGKQQTISLPKIASMIDFKVLRGLKNVNLSKLGREIVLVKKLTEKDIENINVNGVLNLSPTRSDLHDRRVPTANSNASNTDRGQVKSKKTEKKGPKTINKSSKSIGSLVLKQKVLEAEFKLLGDRIPMSLERFKKIIGTHKSSKTSSVWAERMKKDLNFSALKSRLSRKINGDLFPFLKDDDFIDFKNEKNLNGLIPCKLKSSYPLPISLKLSNTKALPKPLPMRNMKYSISTNKYAVVKGLSSKESGKPLNNIHEKVVTLAKSNVFSQNKKKVNSAQLSLCNSKEITSTKACNDKNGPIAADKCEKIIFNGIHSLPKVLQPQEGVSTKLSLPSSVNKSTPFSLGGKNIEISDGTISTVMKTIMSLRSFVRLTDCNFLITQYCPEMNTSGKKDPSKESPTNAAPSQNASIVEGEDQQQSSSQNSEVSVPIKNQDNQTSQKPEKQDRQLSDPNSKCTHSNSRATVNTDASLSQRSENTCANVPYAVKSKPRINLPSTSTSCGEAGLKNPLPFAVKSKPFKNKLNPLPISHANRDMKSNDSRQKKDVRNSRPPISSNGEGSAFGPLPYAVKGRNLSRKDKSLPFRRTAKNETSKQKAKESNSLSCPVSNTETTSVKKLTANLNPRVVLSLDSIPRDLLNSSVSRPLSNPDAPKLHNIAALGSGGKKSSCETRPPNLQTTAAVPKNSCAKTSVPSECNSAVKPDSQNDVQVSASKEKLSSKPKVPVSINNDFVESVVGNDLYDVVKRRTANKNNLNKPNYSKGVIKTSNPKTILESSVPTSSKTTSKKGKRSKPEVTSLSKSMRGEKAVKKSHSELKIHTVSTSNVTAIAIDNVPSPVREDNPTSIPVPTIKPLFCVDQSTPSTSTKSSSRSVKEKKVSKAKSEPKSNEESSNKTGIKNKKQNNSSKSSKNPKVLSKKLSLKLNRKDNAAKATDSISPPNIEIAWKIDSSLRRNDSNAYQYCDPIPNLQSKTTSKRSSRKTTPSLPGNITIKSEPIDDFETDPTTNPDQTNKLKDALSCFDFDESACVDNLSYSPYSSRRAIGRNVECPSFQTADASDFKLAKKDRKSKSTSNQRKTSKKSPDMKPGAVSNMFSDFSEPKTKVNKRRESNAYNSDCNENPLKIGIAVSSRPSRKCKEKKEIIDLASPEERSVAPIITIRMDSEGNNCIVPNRSQSSDAPTDEMLLASKPAATSHSADSSAVLEPEGENSESNLDDKPELKMKLKLKTIMTRNNEPKIVVVGKEFKVADSDEDSDIQEIPWVPEEFPPKKKKKERSGRHKRRNSRSDPNPEYQYPILITNIKKEVVDDGYVEDKPHVAPLRLSLTPIKQSSEVEEMKCEPLKLYRRSNNFYLDSGSSKRKLDEDEEDSSVPETNKRIKGKPSYVGKFASPGKDMSPLKNVTSFEPNVPLASSVVPIPKKPPGECSLKFDSNQFEVTGKGKQCNSVKTRAISPVLDLNIVIKQEPLSDPEESNLPNDAPLDENPEKMSRRRRSSLKCDNYKKYFDSDSGDSLSSPEEHIPVCIRPKSVKKKKPVQNPTEEIRADAPKPSEPQKIDGRRSSARVSDFKKYFDSENGNSSDSDDCKLIYAKLTPKTRRATRGRRRRKSSAKSRRDSQADKASVVACNPCTVTLKRLSSVEVEKHASAVPHIENHKIENETSNKHISNSASPLSGENCKTRFDPTLGMNPVAEMEAIDIPGKNAMDKDCTTCLIPPIPSLCSISGSKLATDSEIAALKDATFYDKEEYLYDNFHRRLAREKKNDPSLIPNTAVASLAKVMAGPNPTILKKSSPYVMDAFASESLHEKVMKENKINCFPFDSPSLISEANSSNPLRRPSLEIERQVFEMPHLNAMKENTINCEPPKPPVSSPGTSTPRIPELSPGSKVFALGNFPADCCSPQTKTIEKDISQGSLLFESGISSKRDYMNYPSEMHLTVQPRSDSYNATGQEDMTNAHFPNGSPIDQRTIAPMDLDKYNISPFAEFTTGIHGSQGDSYKRPGQDELSVSQFYRSEGTYESRNSQPVVDAPFGHASNSMHDNLRTLSKSFDAVSHGSPNTSYYSSEYSSPPESRLPFPPKPVPEPDGFYNSFNRWDTGNSSCFTGSNNYHGEVKPFGSPVEQNQFNAQYNQNAAFASPGEIYNRARQDENNSSYFRSNSKISNEDQTSKPNQFPMDHSEFNLFSNDSNVKTENELFRGRKDALNVPNFSSFGSTKLRGSQLPCPPQKQDRDDCPFDKKMFFREHGYSPAGQYLMQGSSSYSPSQAKLPTPFKRETKMVSRELDFSSESNEAVPKYSNSQPPSADFSPDPMTFNPGGEKLAPKNPLSVGGSSVVDCYPVQPFPSVNSNEICSILSESEDSVSELNTQAEVSTHCSPPVLSESRSGYNIPDRSQGSSQKVDDYVEDKHSSESVFSLESVKCEPPFDPLSQEMKMSVVGDTFMMDCDIFSDSPRRKIIEGEPLSSANSVPTNSPSQCSSAIAKESGTDPGGGYSIGSKDMFSSDGEENYPDVRILDFQECLLESDSEMHPLLGDFELDFLTADSTAENSEPSMTTGHGFQQSCHQDQEMKAENTAYPSKSEILETSIPQMFLENVASYGTVCSSAITATTPTNSSAPSLINTFTPIISMSNSTMKAENLFLTTFATSNYSSNSNCQIPSLDVEKPLAISQANFFYNNPPIIISSDASSSQSGINFFPNTSQVLSGCLSSSSEQASPSGLRPPFNGQEDILSMIVKSCDIGEEFDENLDSPMESDEVTADTNPNDQKNLLYLSAMGMNSPASITFQANPEIGDLTCVQSAQPDMIDAEDSQNGVPSNVKSPTYNTPLDLPSSKSSKDTESVKDQGGATVSPQQVCRSDANGGSPSILPCSQNQPSLPDFCPKSSQDTSIDESYPLDSLVHSFYGEDTIYGLHPSSNCSTMSFLSNSQSCLNTSAQNTPEEKLPDSNPNDGLTAHSNAILPSSQSSAVQENDQSIGDRENAGGNNCHFSEHATNEFLLKRYPDLNSEMSNKLKQATQEIICRPFVSPPKLETATWTDNPPKKIRDDYDDSSDEQSDDESQSEKDPISKTEKERNNTLADTSDRSISNSPGPGFDKNTLNISVCENQLGLCSNLPLAMNLESTPSTSKIRNNFLSIELGVSPINNDDKLLTSGTAKKRKLFFDELNPPQRKSSQSATSSSAQNGWLANQLTDSRPNTSCSDLEGPTLENTAGFKVNIDETGADAQLKHEVQHFTLMSLELHVNSRDEMCPNPLFDPVAAIFYSIYNHTSVYEQEVVGVIAVDSSFLRVGSFGGSLVSLKNYMHSVPTAKNCRVHCVESELELFNMLERVVREWDPDILLGYEIQMASWGYLIERAGSLNFSLTSKLSRVRDKKASVVKKMEEDNTVIDQTAGLDQINIPGRIILNVWRLMRKEVSLNIYTFENVYFHVLHRRTPLYSFKDLTCMFKGLDRGTVVRYYVTRVLGSVELLEKFDLIRRTSEMACLFGIQFYDVLSRGSQFRVESMMLRAAAPMQYIPVSPTPQQRSHSRAPECVPLILEPESKFYKDPVVVLDFQSLYPSMIIAYNYCFSTCLGRVEHFGKDVPFEFGCTSLSIPPSLLRELGCDDIHVSPQGIAFVKSSVRRGVLPLMLEEILNTRVMVKQSMKKIKSNGILRKLLDARQMALKLIANVTYGYTAASFSGRMPNVEVADSVVGKARETLERAIHLIENTPQWKAKVVYGDTDSVFILLEGRTKAQAFEIGQQIADAVTETNPRPVKLKFEKVYLPCFLQTKKRYVGFMYETVDQKKPVFDAKGIETVRRDTCPAAAKILEKSLKTYFRTYDISLVQKYVQKQFKRLLSGRVNIMDCIFAKEYRGMSGYRPGACVPALEIARTRLSVDPRSEPRVGERVPYVVVYGFPGLPIIRLVHEPTDLLKDPNLRINAIYYITRVILPPLERVFGLMNVNVKAWYTNIARTSKLNLPVLHEEHQPKETITQYFVSRSCPSCEKPTSSSVCDTCKNDLQGTTVVLNNKIREWERKVEKVTNICISCTKSRPGTKHCKSVDCPVLFKLNLAKRDASQAPYLRKVLDEELF